MVSEVQVLKRTVSNIHVFHCSTLPGPSECFVQGKQESQEQRKLVWFVDRIVEFRVVTMGKFGTKPVDQRCSDNSFTTA